MHGEFSYLFGICAKEAEHINDKGGCAPITTREIDPLRKFSVQVNS